MPRGKSDANKPRGRTTAYAYFVQSCHEEHKRKCPGDSVNFSEFSKMSSERWKAMADKDKKRFHDMAERDKKRYASEMSHYIPPKGEGRGKRRKMAKDPNQPKRSLSAFFWFCNGERPRIKGENPDFGVGDIAKVLGKLWSELNPDKKRDFEAMAERDKARYAKEMAEYKARNGAPGKGAAIGHVAHDDDDDEEDDDDDDDN